MFWFIVTLGIGWGFYLIYHWAKKNRTILIRFNNDGWCTELSSSQKDLTGIIPAFYETFSEYAEGRRIIVRYNTQKIDGDDGIEVFFGILSLLILIPLLIFMLAAFFYNL